MNICAAIKLDFMPGSDIEGACAEAVRLANLLQCDMVFDFNGVHVHTRPGVDPIALANLWHHEVQSTKKYKMAML